MMSYTQFNKVLKEIRVVRPPRHRLSTFGASEIHYDVVSPLAAAPPRSHLRTGFVKAERPKILTREALEKRFEGFGDDTEAYERWLKKYAGDSFRSLEYTFHNKLEATTALQLDARVLAKKIQKDLDARSVPRAAVIVSPEKGWQFALMKFIVDETVHSFPANVRELEERGLFDPARPAMNRRRREIEALFAQALRDRAAVKPLAAKLKEWGLFEEYQDRFFSLVNP